MNIYLIHSRISKLVITSYSIHYTKLYDGAVAVSRYKNYDVCYDAVKKLTDAGMDQVNIHMLVSEETFEDCLQVVKDKASDPRLEKLNAIVFLSLKPVGKTNTYKSLDSKRYREIIDLALDLKVGIGFDSCSAPKFLKAVEDCEAFEAYKVLAEPCESFSFSIYVNQRGEVTPCSRITSYNVCYTKLLR